MHEADHDAPQQEHGDRRLKRLPDLDERMPAPLAAMADALRANAEALQRIDQSQRKMAETLERSDKAQQVVTSTRAFRGLSEIQKGLLDAVVKNNRAGPGTLVLVLVVAVLAGGIGMVASDRYFAGDKVSRTALDEARREADERSREAVDLKARIREGEARETAWSERAQAKDAGLAAADRTRSELEGRLKQLEADLDANRAKLGEYLLVKQQADQAGQLMQRNMILERDNRTLKEKAERLEEERRKLYGWMGDRAMEMRGGDREAILATAKKLGLYQEEEAPQAQDGPVTLTKRGQRKIVQQLDRLMPDTDEFLRVLSVGAIDSRSGGSVLLDVTLGRYRGGRLVGSLTCKSMTIHIDAGNDMVELRLKDGHIASTARRGEKIPIGSDGHSEFLPEVGLKSWLRREAADVEVGPEGMLTWKTTPS